MKSPTRSTAKSNDPEVSWLLTKFMVESISNFRIDEVGITTFFVKWVGYTEDENTWCTKDEVILSGGLAVLQSFISGFKSN